MFEFDSDAQGNTLLYLGKLTFTFRFWRECPSCRGRWYSVHDPYEPPCYACHDTERLSPWSWARWILTDWWLTHSASLYYHYHVFVWMPTWKFIEQLDDAYWNGKE